MGGRRPVGLSNGRWRATIDEAGVVRAWEVPMPRPWCLILVYSAVAALACQAVAWSAPPGANG